MTLAPTTGQRLGPHPHITLFLFAKAIQAVDTPGQAPVWNGYAPDPGTSGVAPYRIYDMGNEQPVGLLRHIEVLAGCLGKKAKMKMPPPPPRQTGDMPDAVADVSELGAAVHYQPSVCVKHGMGAVVQCYLDHYKG